MLPKHNRPKFNIYKHKIVIALSSFIFIGIIIFFSTAFKIINKKSHILVFSKTAGFRHESISEGITALQKLGKENNFFIDTTENASKFNEDNLQKYSAVIFLSTTKNVLDDAQQADFERYIQAGGGFVGIHAATDTEFKWPWYGKLVGAYFSNHPLDPHVRKAKIEVTDHKHTSTSFLPKKWERTDEWYNFRWISPDVRVLAKVDEKTYGGGTHGDNHPIAWYHEYDGGRAFYTAGGHTNESFKEELFLKHLLGGIFYAIGENRPLNYEKVKSLRKPEENRFVRTVLAEKLNEPMELAITKEGKVYFIERHGMIKMYNPKKGSIDTVAELNVSIKSEGGLLGLALDPEFDKNGFLYINYNKTLAYHYISRFRIKEEKLDLASEKILLKIPLDTIGRTAHTGGSLAFGPDGLLYISLGDNTNPSESLGYAPMDGRQGREIFDAQRSASNTNDLRGKILRIKPVSDGTYSIPEGNLFPKDGSQGKPEIYIMGCRNPYRISIDSKNSILYWGEIGPDSGNDSTYGPRGYDEINQARNAGNYGWPYFIADNKPYREYDFSTGTLGALFDPLAPVNKAIRNTGNKNLPLPQKAMIWYPYISSKDFSMLGKGGRNAMAGPVYHYDNYNSAKKFPKYYDGKLFIYDWMRNWIMAVTMEDDGALASIDPFVPDMIFNKPMDMEFGHDGVLYILEYGTNWSTQNDDSRLVKIEYVEGNRKPLVKVSADKTIGAAPLTVAFSSEESKDFDNDSLRYEWKFTAQDKAQSSAKHPRYTFDKPGIYKPRLTVIDSKGNSESTEIEIKVGNDPPKISLTLEGNRTFFWNNNKYNYEVKVSDKEDGSLESKGIEPSKVKTTLDYLAQGKDLMLATGHQMSDDVPIKFIRGKSLLGNSDCMACHSLDKRTVGPSLSEVATRYKNNSKAVNILSDKIIKGGSGSWGEITMAAHPQHSRAEAEEMVKYILSLSQEKQNPANLPLKGTFTTKEIKGEEGTYIFSTSYTDKGGSIVGPLTSREVITLRHPKVQAEDLIGVTVFGNDQIGDIRSGQYGWMKQIDLTNLEKLTFSYGSLGVGGRVEVRIDGLNGTPVATANFKNTGGWSKWVEIDAPIKKTSGLHDLYFVFLNEKSEGAPLFNMDWIYFHKESLGR